MTPLRCLLFVLLLVVPLMGDTTKPATLSVNLRSRVETFKGSGEYDAVTLKKDLVARETALVICDMWDKHWCESASKRCDVLAKKAAPVVAALRKKASELVDKVGFDDGPSS